MNKVSIINELQEIISYGKRERDKILNSSENINFSLYEKVTAFEEDKVRKSEHSTDNWQNKIFYADNIKVMEFLLKNGYKGKIDLIYIDPPFFSETNYNRRIILNDGEKDIFIKHFAYEDRWRKGIKNYLEELTVKLYLMRDLLSSKGSIYVHLDWHIVHYIKVLMDEIFGRENFVNEIIWSYKSGGVGKRHFSKKHDTILFYSKTKNYIFNVQKEKSYNRELKPYRFKGVKEFKDDIGWYTYVNTKDVWNIDMIGRTSKERVGYDTQKPKKLLERIILSSTDENSIVADFFAGSGTTGVVAEKLKRKWIMSDLGATSIAVMKERLIEERANRFNLYRIPHEEDDNIDFKIKIKRRCPCDFFDECLEIEIEDYEIKDISKLPVDRKYWLKIKDILEKDSFEFVEYIAVDTDYKGNFFSFKQEHYRTYGNKRGSFNKNILLKLEKNLKKRNIAVQLIDVFGNEKIKIINL